MLKLKADWQRVHALNALHRSAPPALQLGASEIAYIAHGFVMGDEEVRACVGAARVEAKALQLLHSFDTGDDLAYGALAEHFTTELAREALTYGFHAC